MTRKRKLIVVNFLQLPLVFRLINVKTKVIFLILLKIDSDEEGNIFKDMLRNAEKK